MRIFLFVFIFTIISLCQGDCTVPVLSDLEDAATDCVDSADSEAPGVLHLCLAKPLGLLIQPHDDGGAFVASLMKSKKKRGSANDLDDETQDQLIGSRIVGINGENTEALNFTEVTDRILQADSPLQLDLEIVDEDDDEDDGGVMGYSSYLADVVAPGQVSALRWEDDGEIIDPFAARVGLPATLVPAIQSYANQLGILDLLKDVLYNDPCEDHEGRFYHTANPYPQTHRVEDEQSSSVNEDIELLWYMQRPYQLTSWKANLHYFSPGNERTFESLLLMLFDAGFGTVVDGIGKHRNLDSIAVQGIGFLGVTHCEEGSLHRDFKVTDGKAFNFLVPVHSAEGSEPELKVAGNKVTNNETELIETRIKYNPEVGMLMGDSTLHGTRECDHRPNNDIRIVMNIFLVDLTEKNVEPIARDMIDIFPVPGKTDWLWAQKGRHWMRGMCMIGDLGRAPYTDIDEGIDCAMLAERGECFKHPNPMQNRCSKSCEVYMDDMEYHPGVQRNMW